MMLDILAIIQLIFVIAKILNKIEWSWVTIFIPAYIYIGVYFIIISIAIIAAIIKNK